MVMGPGSDLSEELVWGCEPVALESVSLPWSPPGPVPVGVATPRIASSSMVRTTMSESRRLRLRINSLEVLPAALRLSK